MSSGGSGVWLENIRRPAMMLSCPIRWLTQGRNSPHHATVFAVLPGGGAAGPYDCSAHKVILGATTPMPPPFPAALLQPAVHVADRFAKLH